MLSLPPEIRLRIYDLCLPDRRLANHCAGMRQRERIDIRLFVICRQIYEEASQAFYGSGVLEISIHGCIDPLSEGHFAFLRKIVKLREVNGFYWLRACLPKIRRLRIRLVPGAHEYAMCETQTILYAVLKRIGSRSALGFLHVSIDVAQPCGDTALFEPQALAPATAIGFLLTPLLTLQRGNVELTVTGEEGQPLSDISNHLSRLIHNHVPVQDFRPFMGYFRALKDVFELATSTALSQTRSWPADTVEVVRGLSHARVQGDVLMFRECHVALVAKAKNVAEANAFRARRRADTKKAVQQLRQGIASLEEALGRVMEHS